MTASKRRISAPVNHVCSRNLSKRTITEAVAFYDVFLFRCLLQKKLLSATEEDFSVKKAVMVRSEINSTAKIARFPCLLQRNIIYIAIGMAYSIAGRRKPTAMILPQALQGIRDTHKPYGGL